MISSETRAMIKTIPSAIKSQTIADAYGVPLATVDALRKSGAVMRSNPRN